MTGHFWPAGGLMRSPLLRGILGVSVTASRAVPIGRPIRDHRGDVIAHPLDIVAFRGHDPHRRLDAALEWIRDDTMGRFDNAIVALVVDGHRDRQIIAEREARERLEQRIAQFDFVRHAGGSADRVAASIRANAARDRHERSHWANPLGRWKR